MEKPFYEVLEENYKSDEIQSQMLCAIANELHQLNKHLADMKCPDGGIMTAEQNTNMFPPTPQNL